MRSLRLPPQRSVDRCGASRDLDGAVAHRSAKKHERQREKTDVIPHGKQKVKELIGQNAGVANVDIKDEDLKGFERIARKYGVDYAVKRVKGQNKYLVFN